jgi:magnesium chelatase family protein
MPNDLSGDGEGEKSEIFREKVRRAREIQSKRFKDKKIRRNSDMSARDLVTDVPLDSEARDALNLAAERLGFSPRVYHRMIKVARTIADLEESPDVLKEHIFEAVEYRPKKFDI